MRAPLIYLDSKDFIDLTDKRDEPEVAPVWNYLLEGVAENRFQLGYSYLHIVEVLNPDSKGHERAQEAYGETIHLLCRGAFPFITDLINGERYPNSGIWMPLDLYSEYNEYFPEDSIKRLINDFLKEDRGLNRGERRRTLSRKNLNNYIKNSNVKTPQEISDLGLSMGMFKKLILDPEKYNSIITKKIYEIASDPRHYSRLISKSKPNENPLFDLIIEMSAPLYDAISGVYDFFREMQEKNSKMITSCENIISICDEIGLGDSDLAKDQKGKIKKVRYDIKNLKISMREDSGILSSPRFEFIDDYLSGMLRQPRRPRNSEMRDIMHLFYAEDVDLVSVDRRLYEIMKNSSSIGNKLVRRLIDLPGRINDLLSASSHSKP